MWLGMATGAMAIVVAQRLAVLWHLEGSTELWLIGAALLCLSTLLTTLIARRTSWPAVLPVFGGIAIGVFVDSEFDALVNHVSRNLWPMDIMFWWVIGVLPIVFGFFSGVLISRTWRK